MQSNELTKLIQDITHLHCESQHIELKKAAGGCPKVYDTLSSFSNQKAGGIIIFGISEPDNYEITGVYDAQDLQKKVTEQCKEMHPVVRALFTVAEIGGKLVVAAEIPEVDVSQRPVYYMGAGPIRGSYIRVGESDEPMSDYEIYSYEAYRRRIRDDLRAIEPDNRLLMDNERLMQYLLNVKRNRRNLARNISDEQILELMGVYNAERPTISGLLAFSLYPQAYFPQLCITAVRIPGNEMSPVNEGSRFLDSAKITGSISDMLEEAVDFVGRNSRNKIIIDSNGRRMDVPEYPLAAVREAVLNALVHRDYSIHTENIPITIEMYSDRLEIRNPGGLYGRLTADELGKVMPESRNPALINILELLEVTENRYSGIPAMCNIMKDANLPQPEFKTSRKEFRVIFRNDTAPAGKIEYIRDETAVYQCKDYKEHKVHKEQKEQKEGRECKGKDLLGFCTVPRSRQELADYTGCTQSYTMNYLIRPLLESGKLRLTIPDKPRSRQQRYVSSSGEPETAICGHEEIAKVSTV